MGGMRRRRSGGGSPSSSWRAPTRGAWRPPPCLALRLTDAPSTLGAACPSPRSLGAAPHSSTGSPPSTHPLSIRPSPPVLPSSQVKLRRVHRAPSAELRLAPSSEGWVRALAPDNRLPRAPSPARLRAARPPHPARRVYRPLPVFSPRRPAPRRRPILLTAALPRLQLEGRRARGGGHRRDHRARRGAHRAGQRQAAGPGELARQLHAQRRGALALRVRRPGLERRRRRRARDQPAEARREEELQRGRHGAPAAGARAEDAAPPAGDAAATPPPPPHTHTRAYTSYIHHLLHLTSSASRPCSPARTCRFSVLRARPPRGAPGRPRAVDVENAQRREAADPSYDDGEGGAADGERRRLPERRSSPRRRRPRKRLVEKGLRRGAPPT